MTADNTPSGSAEMLPVDTLVKLTRDIDNSVSGHGRQYTTGTTFTIEDCIPATESEDGTPFYWGSTDADSINNIWAPADAVELVKTAEQMAARTIPTQAQLLELLSLEIMVEGDGFNINGTIKDQHSSEIECHGTTDDGLPFTFTVVVKEPFRTDS